MMAIEPSPIFDPPYYRVGPNDYERFGVNVRHCLTSRLPDRNFMRRTTWWCNEKGIVYTDLPNREDVYRTLLRDESLVTQFITRLKVPGPRVEQSSFSQVYTIPRAAPRRRYALNIFQIGASSSSGSRQNQLPPGRREDGQWEWHSTRTTQRPSSRFIQRSSDPPRTHWERAGN